MTLLSVDLYDIGPSARAQIVEYVHTMTRDELETIAFNVEWRRKVQRLRKAAAMDGVDPDQLSLIDMHTDLPIAVRYINGDGREDFKHRDQASLRELIDNQRWTLGYYQARAGIEERRLSKLIAFADENPGMDWDMPIGPYIYRDVTCAICDAGWREDDPFEKAHDIAVIAGGLTMQFAHRSCNRTEGVG